MAYDLTQLSLDQVGAPRDTARIALRELRESNVPGDARIFPIGGDGLDAVTADPTAKPVIQAK